MPERPWASLAARVCETLGVAPDQGLSEGEVAARRRAHGDNALRSVQPRSALAIVLAQLKSFIVALLAVAALLSLMFGQLPEAVAVGVVILLNTIIGFATELHAVRSMEALRALGDVFTTVRRDGRTARVPAQDLVVGDVVILDAGDVITADLRLLSSAALQANESTLTGESVPVPKQVEPVAADASLAERASMLFKGTAVTRGTGEAVVVAVGMQSELGRISALVGEAADEETPLERRLEQLGRALAWASLGFVVLVGVAGVATGRPLLVVVETAIALAVATVPEGLPIVATIALARGMWRMARRNALIEHLPAVETLGSTSVILTDKTGTLTENQMTVARLELPARPLRVTGSGLSRAGRIEGDDGPVTADTDAALANLLRAAALCTDAELGREEGDGAVGDPMEVALLVVAAKAGLELDALRTAWPEMREEAFDANTRMMATYHRAPDAMRVLVKGAPEAVVAACDHVLDGTEHQPLDSETRTHWLSLADRLGSDGLRVLAVATRTVADASEEPYVRLGLLGLVGLVDPPRSDVGEAIRACARAGIRVIMVTGDQPGTARYVARAVGLPVEAEVVLGSALDGLDDGLEAPRELLEATVIARCSPEQKLRLLEAHQRAGSVVAMIGDGVNDAPALTRADIGVAMGQRGTQVAREAADMVLQDDRLGTIALAIEQGRAIFDNIRAFVMYLISCNLSEILVVGLASVASAPLPISPLQILFLNLVTDVFPALALGVSEGHGRIMERTPREPREPFLTRAHWQRIGGFSLAVAMPVLASFALARMWLGMDDARSVTVSFLVLAFGQLTHVFDMAERDAPLWRNHITLNAWVWGALALCSALLLAAVYLPWLSNLLGTRDPGRDGWLLVGTLSWFPPLAVLPWRLSGRSGH